MSGVRFTAAQTLPVVSFAEAGGGRLAFVSGGSGGPAVVLLGGAGMGIESWRGVFGGVAAETRVLAYDRPGIGKSPARAEAQSGAVIVRDLRALLAAAGVEGPIVLAGHSLGGLYAQLFARTFPDSVAGVVLVESAHVEEGVDGPEAGALGRVLGRVLGTLRRSGTPSEIDEVPATREQVAAAGPFPAVPLIVVTGTKPLPSLLAPRAVFEAHQGFQRRLLELAPVARQVPAAGSGHMPQITEPGVVVGAILSVVGEVRAAG